MLPSLAIKTSSPADHKFNHYGKKDEAHKLTTNTVVQITRAVEIQAAYYDYLATSFLNIIYIRVSNMTMSMYLLPKYKYIWMGSQTLYKV